MYNLALTTADSRKYPPLVSVAEAAEILGLGRSAVYHLIYRGDRTSAVWSEIPDLA